MADQNPNSSNMSARFDHLTQEELQARQKAAAEFICDGEYRDLLEPMSEVIGALFRTGGDEQQEINQIFARLTVEKRDRVAARCFSMLPQIWEMMNLVGQQKEELKKEMGEHKDQEGGQGENAGEMVGKMEEDKVEGKSEDKSEDKAEDSKEGH
ncbi:hypothetical protein VTJ04DRAFT_10218 [Mycothermus thermophilus]|uniref:uncharacterized protein n=1 Tax=Humicola insolens TaxID=85995 RepID=UPI003742402E